MKRVNDPVDLREQLIKAGLKHIHDFGYPEATEETIVSDLVYGKFFARMLRGTIDDAFGYPIVIKACKELISEIEKNEKESV